MKPAYRPPGWDGHLLLLYHEESQRRRGVASWVRRGLEVGAKILYIEPAGESPERSLSGLLKDQPEAVEALRSGQIQVIPANGVAYDPTWQASVVRQALREYPSVRWSAEATTALGVMPRARHAEIERATDEVCISDPVSAMCQYSVSGTMELLGSVSASHGAGLRERLLQVAPLGDHGIALHGELEMTNQDIMRSVVQAATARTEVDPFEVDLSGLDFVDVSGVRTLLTGTAPYRGRGGRVRVRAPQPHVERLFELFDIEHEQGFVLEGLG